MLLYNNRTTASIPICFYPTGGVWFSCSQLVRHRNLKPPNEEDKQKNPSAFDQAQDNVTKIRGGADNTYEVPSIQSTKCEVGSAKYEVLVLEYIQVYVKVRRSTCYIYQYCTRITSILYFTNTSTLCTKYICCFTCTAEVVKKQCKKETFRKFDWETR